MKAACDGYPCLQQMLRKVMGLQDNIAGTFNGAEQGKEFIPEYVEIAQSSDTFGCIIAKIGLQGSWIRGVALK